MSESVVSVFVCEGACVVCAMVRESLVLCVEKSEYNSVKSGVMNA